MDIEKLNVTERSETGTGPNRRLRASGLVPAIVYGTGSEPIMVSLNYRELEKELSKPNAETNLFQLAGKTTGDNITVVLRDIQRDPLSRRYLHVDLLRVRMDQEADFEVPIHPVGTPVGVREGGIMETHLRSIQVRCLPSNLPEEINVDISKLQLNATFHVSDLSLPNGVTLMTDNHETLFAVHAPKAAKTTDQEEGKEEATEPEIVGKPEDEEEKA